MSITGDCGDGCDTGLALLVYGWQEAPPFPPAVASALAIEKLEADVPRAVLSVSHCEPLSEVLLGHSADAGLKVHPGVPVECSNLGF